MRVGIAGLGVMGKNHLRVLMSKDDVDEVVVYDSAVVDLPAGPVALAKSFDDLVSSNLDYVVVALPTAVHLQYSEVLAKNGIPTLLEKPVALNVREAVSIQELYESESVLCAVGHVERFNPAISQLRAMVGEGLVGTPRLFSTRRVGPYSGRIRDVGVVLDLATHDFDVIHFISGQNYTSSKSILGHPLAKEHEDIFVGIGTLTSGAVVQHSVNWTTPTKVREVSVLGDRGMLVADALRVELRLFKNGEVGSEWSAYENLRGVSEGEEIKFVVTAREPLLLEHKAMAQEITDPGSTEICLLEEAMKTMVVAEDMLNRKSA